MPDGIRPLFIACPPGTALILRSISLCNKPEDFPVRPIAVRLPALSRCRHILPPDNQPRCSGLNCKARSKDSIWHNYRLTPVSRKRNH